MTTQPLAPDSPHARAVTAASHACSLDRRLAACLLAAGGLAAVSGQAHAGIVYSGLQNLSVSIDPLTDPPSPTDGWKNPQVNLEIGGRPFSAGWDYFYDTVKQAVTMGTSYLSAVDADRVFLFDYADNFTELFASNDTIGSPDLKFAKLAPSGTLTSFDSEATPPLAGPWLGQTGFAGIALLDEGDNNRFGWVQLTVPDTFATGSTLTVVDWAYCDIPNTVIQAGSTEGVCASVPEPSVPSLVLLGLGAAGLAGWRRRRAAARLAQAA